MSKQENDDVIYLEQWLSFHPYQRPVQSDYYYLKLSNEIYAILKDDFDITESEYSAEETKNLACFLSCYFEDVISGPGLWRTFIGQVKELYGTWLPFYEPVNGRFFTDEYLPEEINYADVNFLLWYFFSKSESDEDLISPEYMIDSYLPGKVFDILERRYETAPENPQLKQFYLLDPGQTAFSDVNKKLRWIVLDSWLLFFTGFEMDRMIEDNLEEEDEESLPEDTREEFVYDLSDTYALSICTSLLAMQGKEWLARLLGADHPLHRDILEMGEKKTGHYLFTKREGEYLLFRHLSTGTVLNVNTLSMTPPLDAVPGTTVIYAGFTLWRGSWWFSGSLAKFGDDPVLAEKLSNMEHEAMLFREEPEWKSGDPEGQHRAFLEYNRGKLMAFVESRKEAERFIRSFYLHYNESLGLPGRKKRERKQMILTDIRDTDAVLDTAFEFDEPTPGMIFFNPEHGIEAVSGYIGFIPDPDNPWYDPDESADGAMDLLYSLRISGRWVHYILDEYDIPGLAFPGEGGGEMLMENLDFMLRFWKESYYYPGGTRSF